MGRNIFMIKNILQDKVISRANKEFENYCTTGIVMDCDTEKKLYSVVYVDNYGKRSNKNNVRNRSAEYVPKTGDVVVLSISEKIPVIVEKIIQDELSEEKAKKEYTEKDIMMDSIGHTMGNIY